MKEVDTDKINEVLTRGTEDVIQRDHLETALKSGKKLRVKLGIDPTAPGLHLGHGVVLSKLRQFQNLGHKAVLIIGDFTATIGDPSGRSEVRKPITRAEVKKNEKRYLAQAGKIIDLFKTEVRHNSEWHEKQGLTALLELTSAASVQQVLKRQDFAKRLAEDKDITLLETLYPLLQGYDSVAVKADVELGGTDQLLNVLMGRKVQRHYHVPEQDILTVSLLEGLDGTKKMSKSVGNTINVLDTAEEMFGKTMSLPDALIIRWFTLATDVPLEKVAEYERSLAGGANPKDIKQELAFAIVRRYHGEKAATKAADNWENMFSKKDFTAAEIITLKVPAQLTLLELVILADPAKSKSEARRLIEAGGLHIDGRNEEWRNPNAPFKPQGEVVKIGKRSLFKLEPPL